MLGARFILTALVFIGVPAGTFARAKTDLVFLNNGDRLTGEIKQLERGILNLSTDDIGTISIEWEDIDSLSSVYQFRVEDSHGAKYFGAIFRGGGVVEIVRQGQSFSVPADSVVVMEPLEAGFWHQLDGSVSLGFSYTKSDELTQLTFDAWVMRRTTIRQTRLDVDAILSNTSGTDQKVRYDATVDQRRFFHGIFFGEMAGAMQRNDELGLDLRTMAAAALGANLVQTNRADLTAAGGLSVNHEWASGDEESSNLEAVFALEHAIFAYDFPKISYSTQLAVYPSLTDWGRVRVELDFGFRREIVKDFFADISFYDSRDNRPPGGGEKSDYGLVLSLGWSF